MTDLISRRAAIKAIDDLPNCYNGYSDTYDKAYIIGVLEELPKDGCEYWDGESGFCALHRPAAHVKHGEWYDWSFTAFDGCTVWHRACSVCGYKRDDDNLDKDTDYCPNCGARMDGDI